MAEKPSIHAAPGDTVDPARVPERTLYTGARIPAVGLGTLGSDRFSCEDIAEAFTSTGDARRDFSLATEERTITGHAADATTGLPIGGADVFLSAPWAFWPSGPV